MDHDILNEIALCIVVAWVLALGAQLLKQPLILAYLIAGFVVGPIGLGFVKEQASIEGISGLGLMLLLFMIGLEIDLKKVLSAGRIITITGIVQTLGGGLLGLLLFWGLGFKLEGGRLDALYLAVACALSSTVVSVKILYDKRELDTLPGRITLGVLVLQDLFAILFLALQPSLTEQALGLLLLSLFKATVLVAASFVASRYVLPSIFRAVARLPELVLVGALAWCFLVSSAASILGLSREMGALIAGIAISTFPYTLDVSAKVTSLRDFFVTLFFVSLGMSIPMPNLFLIQGALVLALFVVVSRLLTVFPVLHRMHQGNRTSLLPAINLSQLSEFSLVILALGFKAGHLSPQTKGMASYAFVFLAVASTYAILESNSILRAAQPWLTKLGFRDLDQRTELLAKPKGKPLVFLLGFSWTASSLLEEITRHAPNLLERLAIIDYNPQVYQELRKRNVPIIYGDITHRETLAHAGVGEAEMIVCTLSNTVLKGATNLRLLQQLREINPHAKILMHAELFEDVSRLYAAGADYVSVPRLIEAATLCQAMQAANQNLLEEKRAELDRALQERYEVIP
jgi:Kef-type K+ transport system membrane component KefB